MASVAEELAVAVKGARKSAVFAVAKAAQTQEIAHTDKIVAVNFLIHCYYNTADEKKQGFYEIFRPFF